MDKAPILLEEFRRKGYMSTVSSAVLLWEWAISVEDEFQYIWRSPSITNKWVYLISRYVGIISQLVDDVIILSNGCRPAPRQLCQSWISFETAATMIFFGLIEVIQVLRVYAFYHKNQKLGIFLALWFCVEMGGASYYLWFIAIHLDFDPSCAVISVQLINILYPILIMATQAAILFVLFRRRKVIAPGRLDDVPVAYIVLRDGILLFLTICGLIAISMVYAIGQHRPFSSASVLNATLSIAACRMVLNLQSMKRPSPREALSPDEVHLTTLPPSTGVLPRVNTTAPPYAPYSFQRYTADDDIPREP